MSAPILFGRRMKRYVPGAAQVGYRLDSGPFSFRLIEVAKQRGTSHRALLVVNETYHESQDRTTQAGAIRSLTAMRSRLVRQLQDKK